MNTRDNLRLLIGLAWLVLLGVRLEAVMNFCKNPDWEPIYRQTDIGYELREVALGPICLKVHNTL